MLWGIGVLIIGLGGLYPVTKGAIISALDVFDTAIPPVERMEDVLALLLLVGTFSLAFLWIFETKRELYLLGDCFGDQLVPIGIHKPIIFALAILLAVLINLHSQIMWYALVYATFKLTELWSLWSRDRKLLALIRCSEHSDSSEFALSESVQGSISKEMIAVSDYYLARPQVPLAGSFMFVALLAFGLVFHETLADGETSSVRENIAYIIVFVAIGTNEFIYMYWRRQRDRIFEKPRG